MPSPPRRATRSAVPSAASAPPSTDTALRVQKSTSSSSSNSSTSGRAQRSSRKSPSAAHSVSPTLSETYTSKLDQDDALADATRRSQRARKPSEADVLALEEAASAEQNDPEDAEVAEVAEESGEVRCVCANSDYSPPLTEQSAAHSASHPEEADSEPLYISCDKCLVWQHGGCVGIFDDASTPDEYFCEQCKPAYHDLQTDSRGQRYSQYLPVVPESKLPPSRKTSISTKDSKKDRESASRASLDSASARRRPTMNSSRTNYDEEEELRKAIERSKAENETRAPGSRKGKRGRADSDVTTDNKRQRTGSGSEDAASIQNTASINAGSDNEQASSKKKAKANLSEAQRSKELREHTKLKEQQRLDAAERRKDRAGRRRLDDPDMPEDATLDNSQAQPSIDLAPPASPPAPSKKHRKGKPKRSGRNQYSAALERDAASPSNSAAPGNSSGDEGTGPDATTIPESDEKLNNGTAGKAGRAGKWKGRNGKTAAQSTAGGGGSGDSDNDRNKKDEHSIRDMDEATTWMLTCISKTTPAIDANSGGLVGANAATGPGSLGVPGVDAVAASGPDSGGAAPTSSTEAFEHLSSADMAQRIREQIMSWRNEFAHPANSALEVMVQ